MADHSLRGGKTMPHTSHDGVEHAASFWVLNDLQVRISDSAIVLKFVGYHSVAAYDADKQPIAGAEKHYMVSGAAFAAAIGLQTIGEELPIGTEIIRLAWAVALAELDTDGASFFDGAVDAA